jgi:hypothetical protein
MNGEIQVEAPRAVARPFGSRSRRRLETFSPNRPRITCSPDSGTSTSTTDELPSRASKNRTPARACTACTPFSSDCVAPHSSTLRLMRHASMLQRAAHPSGTPPRAVVVPTRVMPNAVRWRRPSKSHSLESHMLRRVARGWDIEKLADKLPQCTGSDRDTCHNGTVIRACTNTSSLAGGEKDRLGGCFLRAFCRERVPRSRDHAFGSCVHTPGPADACVRAFMRMVDFCVS